MTDPNRTHITAVLDRSGSMGPLVKDTLGGFNKFLTDQKAEPGTATMTLVLFDNLYEEVHTAKDLKEVPDLTSTVYFARGGTALYDAMGKAIHITGAALAKLPEAERPGTVIVLVITDGEENQSREFTQAQVKKLVEHQTATYGWKFVFLGANIDAKQVGGNLGVRMDCAMNYSPDSAGLEAAYGAVSGGLSASRNSARRGEVAKGFFQNPDAVLGQAPSVVGAVDDGSVKVTSSSVK